MQNKFYSLLKFLIGWPFSLVALFFIFKLIVPSLDQIKSQIENINGAIFIYGLISFILFYFIRSYIWLRLIKNQGYDLAFKDSCYMWGVSEIRRYIPGNIWSFLSRTMLYAEKGIAQKDTAKNLIVEAELFIFGCAFVSILSLPFLFPGFRLSINSLGGLLIPAGLSLVAVLYIFNRKVLPLFPHKISEVMKFVLPQYHPKENFFLIFLSTIALFFFGLGNYFIIGSYTPLHPQLILELTGFFVLSFLIGYLSILTPAGFGVREGMIIYGLSKLMNTAAFAAIFSRLILIIAELIFITLALLWQKAKSKTLTHIEKWAGAHIQEIIVIFLSLCYSTYFITASFLRYDNFYTGRFDLGNMAQTVWNTLHGRLFLFTNPNGTESISRLAFHADFLLILLTPFYWLWPDPKMLLLIQVLVVAAGAFFVFLIAKHILKNKNLSLVFAFAYLINPSIQRANLYDFHAVTIATTFLLATYYFYLKKRYWLFILTALLSALCKEHLWLITALFGGLLIIRQRKFFLGAVVLLVSSAMFYFLIWYAIPHALGSQHFALSYYSDFGDKPSSVVKSIILSPQKILHIISEKSRTDYLKQLFSPLGYLSVLSPFFLIFATPDFLINLLSNNAQLHQIYYQYTATITPFLFIAAIWGTWVTVQIVNSKWVKERTEKRVHYTPHAVQYILIFYILATSLNAAYKFGPLPGSRDPNIDMFTKPLENRTYINKYLSHIPKKNSVAATNNVGSHLSQRQKIYAIPLGIDRADVIAMLLTDPVTFKSDNALVQKLKIDPKYSLAVAQDKFFVFVRRK